MDWANDNGIFLPMINDVARNEFYLAAISKSVAGKTVVDVGTGTGLLSIIAARSGATKVWSIEQDRARSLFARDLIDKVGLSSKIEVINEDFLNTSIKADYCVTETIGNPFNENILEIAAHARKQMSGTMIPGKFELWVEAFDYHPIFDLCLEVHNQDRFTWSTPLIDDFNQLINQHIDTIPESYKSNHLLNLFAILDTTKIDLSCCYKSEKLIIDLNDVEVNSIEFLIRKDWLPKTKTMVVVFWKVVSNDDSMDVKQAFWTVPCKSYSNLAHDLLIMYNKISKDWWFFS